MGKSTQHKYWLQGMQTLGYIRETCYFFMCIVGRDRGGVNLEEYGDGVGAGKRGGVKNEAEI